MNERIQALALQAGYTKDMFGVGHWDMPECKKFAQLIVAECMNLAEAEQKRYASITHRNMSECAVALGNFSLLMEEHFGVEE